MPPAKINSFSAQEIEISFTRKSRQSSKVIQQTNSDNVVGNDLQLTALKLNRKLKKCFETSTNEEQHTICCVLQLGGRRNMTLKSGSEITIHCEVKPGPTSEERLVSFKTTGGHVTGFVNVNELLDKGTGRWAIRATVLKVRGDVVEVQVRGSFFNTNGLANITRELALAA
jgi:hypothetical protein